MTGFRKNNIYKTQQKFNAMLKGDLEKKIYKKLYSCWKAHCEYCYNNKSNRYYCYGNIGWKVCNEWSPYNENGFFNFYTWGINHLQTVESLSLYLDKDLLDNGLKLIRPESCRWVTKGENTRERNLRNRDKQREIMRSVGLSNKGNHTVTEAQRKARSENAKKVNAKKDYNAQAKKTSETLKEYYKNKKLKH